MTTEPTRWSEGGQVFLCDDKAWGLSRELNTICIGTEDEILESLNGKPADNPLISNIITMDLNNRGKQKMTRRARLKRTRIKN